MPDPNRLPSQGEIIPEVPLIVGGVLLGECSVVIDPQSVDTERLNALRLALGLLYNGAAQPVVIINPPSAIDSRNSSTEPRIDPVLQSLGLRSEYSRLEADTADGRPTAVVDQSHFNKVGDRQGSRAYQALIGGTDERYFYSSELADYVVRDGKGTIVGLHSLRYAKLVTRLEAIHGGIRNFGGASLLVCRELRRKLYLVPPE